MVTQTSEVCRAQGDVRGALGALMGARPQGQCQRGLEGAPSLPPHHFPQNKLGGKAFDLDMDNFSISCRML